MTIAPTATLTNLGNKIAWSITSGKASCSLSKKGGAVKVKLVKAGSCHLQGSAPAVPGQWAPYTIARDYRVK